MDDTQAIRTHGSRQAPRADHGYAWLILFSCCMIRVLLSISDSCMGILLLELRNSFDASATELFAASTTQMGICLCASIFTGMLLSIIGARWTVLIGGLVSTSGYIATCFVTNIRLFFLTYGIIAAVGMSCTFMGSLVPVYSYFEKRKGLALGLIMSSYSIGYFMWPPIVTILFRHYGWRGTIMLVAGFYLNCCVFGALMRPFNERKKTDTTNKPSICSNISQQCEVFKRVHFMCYVLITFLVTTAYAFSPTYLPQMGEGVGASDTSAAFLVSIFGICNCLSRALHGCLSDIRWLSQNRLIICIYAYTLSGICKICVTKASSYGHLATFAAADGFTCGAYLGVLMTVVVDLMPVELMPVATGVLNVFGGAAMVLGNAMSGWIYSLYGTVVVPALVFGCIQICGALLTSLLYAHIKLSKKPTRDDISLKVDQLDVKLSEKNTYPDEVKI